MTSFNATRRSLSRFAALAVPLPAWAQFRVDVTGVGMTQYPGVVFAFKGEDQASVKVSGVIAADLERSGQFRLMDGGAGAWDETQRIDFAATKQRGADFAVVGSVVRLADGRFDVRFRLWDTVRQRDLGGLSFARQDLRLAAHRVADFVYEQITGEKGAFASRIAYVTKSGQRHQLWIADADGENAQAALNSPEPIISPAWHPSGNQLAYVSFESRKPVVYAHELVSGRRRLLASFKGSNSAPAWAPDGRSLLLTLSRDGSSQIYSLDANGGEPKRLIQSSGIDTEGTYAPDGRQIYFVSDRGGSPQIYRMPASGGAAERVTFQGSYNISPSLSQDGRWLAYISRIGGAFKLHVMELSSGKAVALTDTVADESPSFAPNSRLIMYATVTNGVEALMTSTLDGGIKTRLASKAGDIREPEWGVMQTS